MSEPKDMGPQPTVLVGREVGLAHEKRWRAAGWKPHASQSQHCGEPDWVAADGTGRMSNMEMMTTYPPGLDKPKPKNAPEPPQPKEGDRAVLWDNDRAAIRNMLNTIKLTREHTEVLRITAKPVGRELSCAITEMEVAEMWLERALAK